MEELELDVVDVITAESIAIGVPLSAATGITPQINSSPKSTMNAEFHIESL
jgi:hypothetical protein